MPSLRGTCLNPSSSARALGLAFFSGLKECGRGFLPFSPAFFLNVYLVSNFLEFGYFVSNEFCPLWQTSKQKWWRDRFNMKRDSPSLHCFVPARHGSVRNKCSVRSSAVLWMSWRQVLFVRGKSSLLRQ